MNGWGKAPHPPMRKVNSSKSPEAGPATVTQSLGFARLVSVFLMAKPGPTHPQPYSTTSTHFHESLVRLVQKPAFVDRLI